MQRPYTVRDMAERAGADDHTPPTPRRISIRDRLLVHLACWCRSRMSTVTAFSFDLATYDLMVEVQAQAPAWRGVAEVEAERRAATAATASAFNAGQL